MKKLPTRPGYRVFIDISSFKQVSSFFLSKKSDQIKMIPMWIKGLSRKYGTEIERIKPDNSGENKSLQKECDKQNLGVIFEFTAPGTPQQNSVVERRIPTLMGRARAMLIQAGINSKEKGEFWFEVISTATNLDNIMVRPDRTKPPYTLFYNKDAKFMKHLGCFGEMAVVAIHEGKKMRSKFDNRGETCMFVGYADDHSGDVYSVENSSSLFILISCSQGILNSSRLSCFLLSKIACLHVSFTAYENFYKLSKMYCPFVLIFHFPFFRISECRNPTIKHISNYTCP